MRTGTGYIINPDGSLVSNDNEIEILKVRLAAADALYKAAKYALSENPGDWKNPLADAMKDYEKMTGGK